MTAEQISATIPRSRHAAAGVVLLWLIPATIYYAFLLTAGSSGLFAPVTHGLTFNSMLLHLLHGRFDVDPAVIGDEGFLRDGAVYAYFGIFPALFRAVFLWLPGFAQTDFTRLACLGAVSTMALFKVMSVRFVWREAGGRAAGLLLALMIAAIVAGGPQVQFLRPSIFEEVELWAGALSAAFVYLVLRGLLREDGFTPRLLSGLAVTAGLCLTARVSNALGLYIALGLVWLCVAWRRRGLVELALPLAILAVFAAITALVNVERWGNPLVFADFTKLLMFERFPDRLAHAQQFGQFSLARIPYALGYYFAPFWVLRDSAGQFLWSGFEPGIVDCGVELPPSSFFISDPLLIGLGVYGAVHTLRKGASNRALVPAVAAGLAVPCPLILAAFGMAFRYRMEFYPLFELFAFLGFARLAAQPAARVPAPFAIAAVAGIVTAHLMWMLYMLSPFGPAGWVMGTLGIADFYRSLFH